MELGKGWGSGAVGGWLPSRVPLERRPLSLLWLADRRRREVRERPKGGLGPGVDVAGNGRETRSRSERRALRLKPVRKRAGHVGAERRPPREWALSALGLTLAEGGY